MLDRDAIKGIQDIRVEKVDVPEWGGEVYVKSLSGSQRDEWENGIVVSGGKMDVRGVMVRLVIMTACDETGKPVFKRGDETWLNEKSSKALTRLADKARELAGLTQKDIEVLAKNSETDPSANSGSN